MCVPCEQCKLIIIYSTTPHGSFSERKLKLVTAITSKKYLRFPWPCKEGSFLLSLSKLYDYKYGVCGI